VKADHARAFYTHGLSDLIEVAPAGQNGKATATPLYGFDDVVFDNDLGFYAEGWGGNAGYALCMARLDGGSNEIDHHRIGAANQSLFFVANRYFSLARGGRYRLTLPNGELPQNRLRVEVNNAWRSSDEFVVGLPWSGTSLVKGKIDFCTSTQYWYTHAQKVANNHTREGGEQSHQGPQPVWDEHPECGDGSDGADYLPECCEQYGVCEGPGRADPSAVVSVLRRGRLQPCETKLYHAPARECAVVRPA